MSLPHFFPGYRRVQFAEDYDEVSYCSDDKEDHPRRMTRADRHQQQHVTFPCDIVVSPTEDEREEEDQLSLEVQELLKHLDRFTFDDTHDENSNKPVADDDDANSNPVEEEDHALLIANEPVVPFSSDHNDAKCQDESSISNEQEISVDAAKNDVAAVAEDDGNAAPSSSNDGNDGHAQHFNNEDDDTTKLVQQARAERDALRQWAVKLRKAVTEYLGYQQTLMRTQQQQQQNDETSKYQKAIRSLQAQLDKIQQQHRDTELSLYEIIRYQQARLMALEQQIAAAAHDSTKTKTLPDNSTNTPAPSATGQLRLSCTRHSPLTASPTAAAEGRQFNTSASCGDDGDDEASEDSSSGESENLWLSPATTTQFTRTNSAQGDGEDDNDDDTESSQHAGSKESNVLINDPFPTPTPVTELINPTTMTPGTTIFSPMVSPSSSSSSSSAGRRQRRRSRLQTDDCEIITYGNGAVREIYYADKSQTIRFPNGDVQHITTGGDDNNATTTSYFYSATGVIQVEYGNDKTKMEYHYPNGQVEEHYQDGSKIVLFADGSLQCYDAAGAVIKTTSSMMMSSPKAAGTCRPL